MNRLAQFIAASALDETQAMNDLQGAGVVSDNAVGAMDVAEADLLRAIAFLREQVRL